MQPRATLETFVKSKFEFIDAFCEQVVNLLPHAFVAEEQTKYSRHLKEMLNEGEFLVLSDFAENYTFTVQNAAPGFHWNNDQATVYNIVVYYKEGNVINHCSLVIISDCLEHDTVAVYTYHSTMIELLKRKFSIIEKIFYFTDGAPQHYKNFKNIINLAKHHDDFNIQAEWHFFPTAHGKGPCDGLGATVKRSALRASLQCKKTILTAFELYEWLQNTDRLQKIDFVYCDTKQYKKMSKRLRKRFDNKHRIKNLQNKHCLISLNNGYIRAKTHSFSSNYCDYQIL